MNTAIDLIEKELVDSLSFPQGEILKDEQKQHERLLALKRANTLGNLEKQKVVLEFHDNEGIKAVYTTIWAVTEAKALLKAGKAIPIERISRVKFVEP